MLCGGVFMYRAFVRSFYRVHLRMRMRIRWLRGYRRLRWSKLLCTGKTRSTSALSISLHLLLTRFFPRSWGRILISTGSIPSPPRSPPSRVSVSFIPADGSSALPVLVNGESEVVDERRAKEILKEEFEVRVELGLGNESARY
jgi:hypothetical protein